MAADSDGVESYKRAQFSTRLPVAYRYSPSHWWAAEIGDGVWRAGVTKFSTRMLGEMVDFGVDVKPGGRLTPGQIIGWIEGFKAISDMYCVADGRLEEVNPALEKNIRLIGRSPYRNGWVYSFRGQPDDRCMDVAAYARLLDKTIDKILEQQKGEEIQ